MLKKLQNHIQSNFSFLVGKKLLIAISGGVDSVVLTHLLHQLNFDITLVHCNYKLRGKESDLDETFVKALGQELNLTTYTKTFQINTSASIQIKAREVRYNWFKELQKEYNYDYILTAHHADDNLETFLINLTRGSGLEGFTGIPEINGTTIRVLLPFSRIAIINYAHENNITWREDKSNASTKYVRNKIRHQIAPVLKEINPNLLDTFAKTVENLKESKTIIDDRIKAISSNIISEENDVLKLNIAEILKLSNPKAYLYELLKAYNFKEWKDILNLLTAQSGKQVFSKTHMLLKNRDFLLLSKKEKLTTNDFYIEAHQTEISSPIKLKIDKVTSTSTKSNYSIYIDRDKLEFPLKLRKWQNGDVFYPSGMQGKKKLSKYFKDEKFSMLEKQNTWLLCNANDSIIWVVGFRLDRRFAQNKQTKKILKISLINN